MASPSRTRPHRSRRDSERRLGVAILLVTLAAPAAAIAGGAYATERNARAAIKDATADNWRFCADTHAPAATVELTVIADDPEKGGIRATTPSDTPFARCFAEQVKLMLVGGSDRFAFLEFKMTIKMPPPGPELARAVAGIEIAKHCMPLPGVVPASASLDVSTDRSGMTVRAATTPENLEVNRCLERAAIRELRAFATFPGLHAERKIAIGSIVEKKRFADEIAFDAEGCISACYPEDKRLRAWLKVRVSARREATTFAISDDSGQPAFSACFRDHLLFRLLDRVTVDRDIGTNVERYRRIDRDVDVTVTVPALTPEQAQTRPNPHKDE
jgi:hypothetical protein